MSKTSRLTLKVLEGKGLASKDPNGMSDPYCIIGIPTPSLSEFQDNDKCTKSETKYWSLNPTWKQAVFATDEEVEHVRVEVWDKDQEKADDFMGFAIIKINEFSEAENKKWFPLHARSAADGTVSGKIHVQVVTPASKAQETKPKQEVKPAQVTPVPAQVGKKPAEARPEPKPTPIPKVEQGKEKAEASDDKATVQVAKQEKKEDKVEGVLRVHIRSASGIPAIDDTGSSDPYCKVGLTDTNGKWIGESSITPVVCATCNPSWGEGSRFEYKIMASPTYADLKIEVWDKGATEGSDFVICHFELPLKEIMAQAQASAYNSQLVVDPNLKRYDDNKVPPMLNWLCSYISASSPQKEDEWLVPRHERVDGKALIHRAEELLSQKSSQKESELNSEAYKAVLQGYSKEGIQSRLVRVFVSSTFTDTEKERNLLMVDVYTFMQRLCKVLGMEFETVDMRWGVRQETTLSHNTSSLCMSEIEKCVTKSFGPAFLCLLGDKYGYRPFPSVILKSTLEKMWQILCDEKIAENATTPISGAEHLEEMKKRGVDGTREWDAVNWKALTPLSHIPTCFRLDHNMKEPHYVLESRYEAGLADDKIWWPIFEDLQKILRRASKVILQNANGQDDEELYKFEISVTQEEVHNGILFNNRLADQTICVLRSISDVQQLDKSVRGKYVDTAGPNIDTDAVNLLAQLKAKVSQQLGSAVANRENVIDIDISSAELDPTAAQSEIGIKYRRALSDTICKKLADKLLVYFENQGKINTPLYDEILRHIAFRSDKLAIYVERLPVQQKLKDYLTAEVTSYQGPSLIVTAPSGAGKTALMAWASQWAVENIPGSVVITRFLGTSPQSSDVLSLLQSVCLQLIEFLKVTDTGGENQREEHTVKDLSPVQLSNLLIALLKEAAAQYRQRKIIIILDSLDQLLPSNGAHLLHWLPLVVPSHVRLIASILIPAASTTPSADSSSDLIKQLHTNATVHGGLNEFEIAPMGDDIATEMLRQILGSKQRTLTVDQQNVVLAAYQTASTPLYMQVAATIAQTWNSWTPVASCVLEPGMRGIINQVFTRLEKKHGELLMSKAFSYLVESRNGLSSAEIEDVLSCDEEVLSDIFEWWTPPVRRLPPLLWKRIREDLGKFVVEKGVHGVNVHSLYHRQFREAAKERYVNSLEKQQKICAHLAKFFNGEFSSPQLVPFINKKANNALQGEDRLIAPQPLRYTSAQFNRRKLSELPYLQTKSGNYNSFSSSLFNFDFIEAKAQAGMLDELDEDYEFALATIEEQIAQNSTQDPQIGNSRGLLSQFHRFIRRRRHVISLSPKDTLMHALNEPSSLQITRLANEQWRKNAVHSSKVIYKCVNTLDTQDPCVLTLKVRSQGAFCLSLDKKTLISDVYDEASKTNCLKLWNLRNGQEIMSLSGHQKEITCCQIASDGKIVSSSLDKTIRVWDKNQQIRSLATNNQVKCFALTSDLSKLVCGSTNDAQVLDFATGEILHSHKFKGFVQDCAISFDNKLFAANDPHTLVILEVDTGKVVFETAKNLGQGLVFFDDQLYFADGNAVKIWDKVSNEVSTFVELRDPVSALAVDKIYVTTASAKVLTVWDAETRENLCTMRGHSLNVKKLVIDSHRIISTSNDGTMRIWDIDLGLDQQYSIHNGKVILCKVVKRRGKFMAVMCAEGQPFKAWNIETGELAHEFDLAGGFDSKVTNDGTKLGAIDWDDKGTVVIWDLASESEIQALTHDDEVGSFSFSPDGSKIVSIWGYQPTTITIWDIESGKRINSFDTDEENIRVEFLDDKRIIFYVLTTMCDGKDTSTAKIMDIATLKTQDSFEFYMDMFLHTQINQHIVVASTDVRVKVWDIATNKTVFEFKHYDERNNITTALTQDTLYIAHKGGVIQILERNKNTNAWEEISTNIVVNWEIVGIFANENHLVVCCEAGDVFFFTVTK